MNGNVDEPSQFSVSRTGVRKYLCQMKPVCFDCNLSAHLSDWTSVVQDIKPEVFRVQSYLVRFCTWWWNLEWNGDFPVESAYWRQGKPSSGHIYFKADRTRIFVLLQFQTITVILTQPFESSRWNATARVSSNNKQIVEHLRVNEWLNQPFITNALW